MVRYWCLAIVGLAAVSPARADDVVLSGVKARLIPASRFVDVGRPVWVDFTIQNTTGDPVALVVPALGVDGAPKEMGLPTSHVFSGNGFSAAVITDESNRRWNVASGYEPPESAPAVLLAPYASVSRRLDLREYYPALRAPGKYRIRWEPYGGALTSDLAFVEIGPLKRAEIQTDAGVMTLELFYDDAPNTVANFLELAASGFYTATYFHTIQPGYMIVGGCPIGDGTGIRKDGKKIPPEFNDRPHQKGSVSMALVDDDPQSASCQFFICNTRQPEWDGRYTVFAQIVGEDSFATLDRLLATPVDATGRPTTPGGLAIRGVRILNAPREVNNDR